MLSPQWLLALMGLIVVLTWGILAQHRYHDRHQQFRYSDTEQGVRVIGLRPHTPADKLNLDLGDIILECNRQPVNTEAELVIGYTQLSVGGLCLWLASAPSAFYCCLY
ncbi:hypothetical protein WP50_25390 [Lactiplantibacillus plantarum]|nr:hypothetical protein WP50_25390 [Lactiplantibacillus plantarum]